MNIHDTDTVEDEQSETCTGQHDSEGTPAFFFDEPESYEDLKPSVVFDDSEATLVSSPQSADFPSNEDLVGTEVPGNILSDGLVASPTSASFSNDDGQIADSESELQMSGESTRRRALLVSFHTLLWPYLRFKHTR